MAAQPFGYNHHPFHKTDRFLDVQQGIWILVKIKIFEDTNLIYALELYAAVAAIVEFRSFLRHSRIVLFVDNEAADLALIKASSKCPAVHALIQHLWAMAASTPFSIWIERASSKANPADLPSRKRDNILPVSSWGQLPLVREILADNPPSIQII